MKWFQKILEFLIKISHGWNGCIQKQIRFYDKRSKVSGCIHSKPKFR